jgi:hypothetical protein
VTELERPSHRTGGHKVRVTGRFIPRPSGGRRWSPPATVVLLASTGAVLVAYGLVVALAIKPPPLGWVGFAIVSAIVLGLAALAPLAFERTRVSPRRPARGLDRGKRLLVVADSNCDERTLCDEILARFGDVVAVHVVVPVRVSRLHFVTDDESAEWHEARRSMLHAVGLLRRRVAVATGSVGSDKPLESMSDALGFFPATHVLLATPPEEESYWLERGLLAKARTVTRIPVTQVVVPTTPPTTASIPDATRQCAPGGRSG